MIKKVNRVNSILNRIITRLRVSFFPTPHDIELKRWFFDDKDEKLRYEYKLNSNSLVIDLGGYKGQWASDMYARYNSKIMVFEPVKSFAEKIEGRFKSNNKIDVFCFALGASSRNEIIALSADGSSVYGSSLEKETIQIKDVFDFFIEYNISNVDLMKINIEGGEYELMLRILETGLVGKIKNIQIQFHDVGAGSEERMNEIYKILSETHRPTYQYKFVWENWALID